MIETSKFEELVEHRQIISQNSIQICKLLRILPLCTKNPALPDLFCVEITRHSKDLGVSIVLQATCELTARREVLRLFPEYKYSLVHMRVSLVRYVEVDWDANRTLVIKKNMRREIPAAVAEIAKSFIENPPLLRGEGDANEEGDPQ